MKVKKQNHWTQNHFGQSIRWIIFQYKVLKLIGSWNIHLRKITSCKTLLTTWKNSTVQKEQLHCKCDWISAITGKIRPWIILNKIRNMKKPNSISSKDTRLIAKPKLTVGTSQPLKTKKIYFYTVEDSGGNLPAYKPLLLKQRIEYWEIPIYSPYADLQAPSHTTHFHA